MERPLSWQCRQRSPMAKYIMGLEILGLASFGWLFAEIFMPMVKRTFFKRQISDFDDFRLKPWDCAMCFTLWLSLIIFEIQSPGWMPVLFASICSVTATIISKIMNRL